MRKMLLVASFLVSAAAADAAEIRVSVQDDFLRAFRELAPRFERSTGNSLAVGEPADVVIVTAPEMDELARQGKVAKASRIDLARFSRGEPKTVTVLTGAVLTGARERKEATALLGFLSSRSAAPAIRKAGLEPTTRKPDLADLSEGTYFGNVISDSKGSSKSDVTLNVVRIDRNLVRITSDYARLPVVEVPLTRAMDQILMARGNTVFNLEMKKSPAQLGVSFNNEVSWAGARR